MKTIDTATATAPSTYDRSARENRLQVLAQHKLSGGKMKALTGNTWPLKSMLYAYGSLWNKEAKTLEVPECVHSFCQDAIDGYEKAHPKASKPKADKPAVTITAAQVKAAAVVDTRPATGIPKGVFAARIYNLNIVTDQVTTDLLSNGHTEAARLVVSAMAAFNEAHKLLA